MVTVRPTGRGTNLPRMADYNESVILDAIRCSPAGVSRAELSAMTGLSAQTISNISRRIIDQGLVIESDPVSVGSGKPRTPLRLNPSGRYAIGIHIDPAVLTFVVLDLTGAVVARTSQPTPSSVDPEPVLANMRTTVRELVTRAGIDHNRVVGLGIASPGPIDHEHGNAIDPPHLAGWHRVPLRQFFEDALDLPVLLDKDVLAAAVAERWAGAASGVANSAFMYLGTGIGVGLTIGDAVVRGASSNAGDLGHLLVDPDGPECECGLRGCLGTSVSPLATITAAAEAGLLPNVDIDKIGTDPRKLIDTYAGVCRLASDGDGTAGAIIDRSAHRLAKGISTIANLLDLELIVIGGPLWSLVSERYLAVVPAVVADQIVGQRQHPVPVVGTGLGDDVGAIGAACLILERTFSAHTASLLLGE